MHSPISYVAQKPILMLGLLKGWKYDRQRSNER
jgi:hypothetical protein